MNENLSVSLPDGRNLSYAEYGDPSGYPILYFPGFPCCRIEARKFHEMAMRNHCRLISIDRPGLAKSSFQKKRNILSWPSDIKNLVDTLAITKFSIIGHSAASSFIAACAYAIPERLTGAAIVSGLAPLDLREARASMSSEQKLIFNLVRWLPSSATILMWMTYQKLRNQKKKSQMDGLPEVDESIFNDPRYHTDFMEMLRESFRSGVAGPARELQLICKSWGFNLGDIQFPIDIWHGSRDSIAPVSHAKILARLIPNTQVHILEHEGHLSILTKPLERIFHGLIKR